MTPAAHPTSAAAFPWRAPRRERLVLVLVALATLTPVYAVSSQDVSRLCLTRALLAGRLTIDQCGAHGSDRARYGGHVYSDKAPGISLFALPAVEATQLPAPSEWNAGRDLRLWMVRLTTGGIAFLLLVWALGRVAEGVAPGSGAFVAVTFALGTFAGGLAATTFDQVAAAALGFGAFLLGWRGRPWLAGLAAGLGVLVEYQAALLLAAVALYLLLRRPRDAVRFIGGTAPGIALLALYDWAAFGSPLHASYRYVANGYAQAQARGFFGISLPRWHSVTAVLVGSRGLLIDSPVLLAAAVGVALLARRRPREAALCGLVTALFLALEFGYFLPYGGVSPGPRFMLPALPFLALGLAPAYARRPALTAALALPSILASTAVALTWALAGNHAYPNTIWGELFRVATLRRSPLRGELSANVLGIGTVGGAAVVAACSCVAFAVSGCALMIGVRDAR